MAPVDLAIHAEQFSQRQKRSHSTSSDRPSISSSAAYGGLLSPPATVSPDPAFIAASAASQIVTNDHDSQADAWFDQHGIEPSGETALVSPPALKLINRFLDQLLFNFLLVSRSTSLASLRPAVAEVLKPKLAKDAINGADQELQEYLGGGEEEELLAFHNGLNTSGDWDLELVWKRTRLRCMVYSSLGDMEEEDEDYYTEQEQLDGPPGSRNRFSNNLGVVSPAVAIFLTSVLEFMGEQVLVVAGQAAYHKLRAKHEKEERDGTSTSADIAERVVVQDSDMEKVALDRTLGRLWRGWKKRIRSPSASVSLGRLSCESLQSPSLTGKSGYMSEDGVVEENERRPSLAVVLAEYEHAASIPLPMNNNDIREIEVPGLAHQSDAEEEDSETDDEGIIVRPRPKSTIVYNSPNGILTPNASQPQTPTFISAKGRKRSNSLPSPPQSIYTSTKRIKPTIENAEETNPETQSSDYHAEVATKSTALASTEEDQQLENEEKSSHGVLAQVVAGAATIGAAAIAGIVAVAQGQAPQTELIADELDPEEEFAEEPQILTSSRISLPPAGRVSPGDKDPTAPSRQSSVRSSSVHSLRLIDVGSARSPGMSRAGSVDGGRPSMISRPSSTQSPVLVDMHMGPRGGSPVLRGPTASPLARNGSSMSTRQISRNSAGNSISEMDEGQHDGDSFDDHAPNTAVPTELATAMAGVDIDMAPILSSTATPPAQFATQSQTQEANRKPAFVLSAAPPPRHHKESSNVAPTQQSGLSTTMAKSLPAPGSAHSRSMGAENVAPAPLTPLRELMEVGPEKSVDHSSQAPRPMPIVQSHGQHHAHSLTSIPGGEEEEEEDYEDTYTGYVPHMKPRKGHQDAWKAKEQAEIEKAARDKAERARTQANKGLLDHSNSPPRQIHTSGSGSSAASSSKLKAHRMSEDAGSSKDVKSQSFEQLIRSDTTIQYTLTPQNMRDIESSPVSPRFPTSGEVRPQSGRSHSSSLSKFTQPASAMEFSRSFKSIPRPLSNTGSRLRQNVPQAREARVNRDSMSDFSEFIRSTGPVHPQGSITESRVAHKPLNGARRNLSGSVTSSPSTTSLPKRSESSAGRVRLQAREAAVPRGDSISDLIDFVRSGPQLDRESHRIPRTVAPFRTTMDSDQMSGAVGGKAIDASLSDARYSQATSSMEPSVEGSVSSQSGLLGKQNFESLSTVHSALVNNHKAKKPSSSMESNYNAFEEEDRMPKRKTRRVRDPYAIDLSDEDEEEFAPAFRPKPIEEESLADFLRSVPPPPEPTVLTSAFDDVPRPGTGKTVKKKSSTPGLMSRFGRRDSSQNIPQQRSAEAPPVPKAPAYTPIAAKFTTTYGKNPNDVDVKENDDYSRQGSNTRGKVVQQRYQPREATLKNSGRVSDMADFLMSNPPPSPSSVQPKTFAPTVPKEEKSSFQRMFGRGKKH